MVQMHHATANAQLVATEKSGSDLAVFFFSPPLCSGSFSNRLFMYNTVSLIIWSVKVYSSLSPSSSFTRIMLLTQVSSFSQTSGFSNHLQDLQLQHIITCAQRQEEETEEKTHFDTDLREPEAPESQKGLIPRTNCIRYYSGFQAPNF